MNFYKRTQNKYGLPLDNRRGLHQTRLDSCGPRLSRKSAQISTPSSSPFTGSSTKLPIARHSTDWYETGNARKVGFTARPVLGGVFLQMLYDREVWQKWARRDTIKAAVGPPMPRAPKIVTVVPAADQAPRPNGISRPTSRRMIGPNLALMIRPGKNRPAGFGARGTPARIHQNAMEDRRYLVAAAIGNSCHFLPVARSYGCTMTKTPRFSSTVCWLRVFVATARRYEPFPLTPDGKAAIKTGTNLIAIHCHQTTGGQYIDAGFVEAISQE